MEEVEGLPMILGLSEDTWAPRGSIADDKVTRLRVNLCYLHLITVSCAPVPADRSLSVSAPPGVRKGACGCNTPSRLGP